MAKTANTTARTASPAVTDKPRLVISLKTVQKRAPDATRAAAMAAHCGLDEVDYDTVHKATFDGLLLSGEALKAAFGGDKPEVPAKIQFQGVVDAYVRAANRTAEFWHDKLSDARGLASRLGNEDRDEDRDGPSGFESKVDAAWDFAGRIGLQAYAGLAAAEAACAAFEHLTGEPWTPYQPPVTNTRTVSRQSLAAKAAAFGE